MINQKFDYLYTENGRLKAVVVDKNGEPQVTDVTPDKPYSQSLITDGQGDTLVVSKKGQVMGVKEYKFAGDDRHLLNEYHRQLDSLGEWQINFTPAKNQTYAFDQIGSGNHGIFATDQYYPTSGNYDFRYKSVECGKSDRVVVDFGSYPEKDSVIFKDKYGVKLKVVDGNILSFTGVSKVDTNFIYAYRGDKKIGKLFLNTYQQKTYKVVLVRVNKAAKKLDIDKVNEVLNKVYNQCAVKFEISIEEFDLRDLTSFSHGGSGILSVYNEDQKKVLRAFDNQMKDGVFYLFFVDNVTDKKDGSGTPVSGYMPRGYNAGFIYDGGSPHTIAHELGHGIAGLEHVFENSNASGKTANLMDYSIPETATELWHFQWNQIQDPNRVWMKWNKAEEEGENIEASYPFYVLKFLEAFRRAVAYGEIFNFDILDAEFSAENLPLLSGIKCPEISWKTYNKPINFSRNNNHLIRHINEPLLFGETEYQYSDNFDNPSFKITSYKVDIASYLLPTRKTFETQMNSLRELIANKLQDRDYLIRYLSILPEQEYEFFSLDLRKQIMIKLVEGSLLERESFMAVYPRDYTNGEKAVINLIKYVPSQDLSAFLKFLKDNHLYAKLADKIDNVGGADNYDELYRVVREQWNKCNPNKEDEDFIKDTQQAFLRWYFNKNRMLIHWDFTLGVQAGIPAIGGNASVSVGLAIDLNGNIGLFGNTNIFAYLLHKGIHYNQMSDVFQISLKDAMSNYKKMNVLSSIDAGADFTVNFDFWASDMRDLFGLGTTEGCEFSFEGKSIQIVCNKDGSGKFIGLGIGTGLSATFLQSPIKPFRISETNKGLIFHKSELSQLSDLGFDPSKNQSYSIEKRYDNKYQRDLEFLIIKIGSRIIKTNIIASWGDRDHNYIITHTALTKYEK